MKRKLVLLLVIFFAVFVFSTSLLFTPQTLSLINSEQSLVGAFTKGDLIAVTSMFFGTSSFASFVYLLLDGRRKRKRRR